MYTWNKCYMSIIPQVKKKKKKIFPCHQPPIPGSYVPTVPTNTTCWSSSSKNLLCSYKSGWICQGCKPQPALCPSHFSDLYLQQAALRNEVTPPHRQKVGLLLLCYKSANPPSWVFLGHKANPFHALHLPGPTLTCSHLLCGTWEAWGTHTNQHEAHATCYTMGDKVQCLWSRSLRSLPASMTHAVLLISL